MSASFCWSHHRSEPVGSRTFIVCGECGHAYSRFGLWRALQREVWMSLRSDRAPAPFDPTPARRTHTARTLLRGWFTRPSRIYFCQECIHDF